MSLELWILGCFDVSQYVIFLGFLETLELFGKEMGSW